MSKFEIDITEDLYVRRLGLRQIDGDDVNVYQLSEDGPSGWAFPYSVEEAAFLMVGLKWEPYAVDLPSSFSPLPKIPKNKSRLKEFFRRDGCVVYQHLSSDLISGNLPNLSLESLYGWVCEKSGFLKFFNKDLHQQVKCVVEVLRGKPTNIIKATSYRKSTIRAIERMEGYDISSLEYKNAAIVPKVLNEGKKGQDYLRHRSMLRSVALIWISKNPLGRPVDFRTTPEFNAAVEGTRYELRTIKKWLKGIPFNRSPGRPKINGER